MIHSGATVSAALGSVQTTCEAAVSPLEPGDLVDSNQPVVAFITDLDGGYRQLNIIAVL